MRAIYLELAERIRGEAIDLDQVVNRATRAWPQAGNSRRDQDLFLDAVALNLHSFYSGIERLFELIGRRIDGHLPEGETWHRDLIEQMASDLAEVRPAVIAGDTARQIDVFRRFRHLVRNLYTVHLLPERMAELMSVLPDMWDMLRRELLAFADFLEELASASEGEER